MNCRTVVVLPDWRGPFNATTRVSAKASCRRAEMWRGDTLFSALMPCRPFWILAASIMESSAVQSGFYHRPIRNLSSSNLEWNHGPHQAQGGDSAGGPDRLGPIVVDKAVKVKSGRGMIEIRRCRYE